MAKMIYAIEIDEGKYFDFKPVKGDPRTERYYVVRHEANYVIVKELSNKDLLSTREENFNQYAEVTPVDFPHE